MIKMKTNLNEVVEGILTKVSEYNLGAASFSLMRDVATGMLSAVGTRVFEEGQNSTGAKIGNYSTKPIYVSLNAIPKPKGAGRGKTGKTKFKNGNPHKSKYFDDGYFGYKTDVGRNKLGSVNFSLTGDLSNQFRVIPTQKGYGIGWDNTEMFERANYLNEKFGSNVWALTEQETQQVTDFINESISNNLKS